MIETQQVIDWVTNIVTNWKQGAWLATATTVMLIVSILWKGDYKLPEPLTFISTWIANEQKKHFSSYCQYISRGLTILNAAMASLVLGMPFSKALVAAIIATWGGTVARDIGSVGVKAALKATPKIGVFVLVLGCIIVPGINGCWLSNVCGESGLQVMHDVAVQLGEAQSIVDSQEQAIAQMQTIPADKAAEIQAAFVKVHTAIEVAEASDKTAQLACSGAGIVAILGGVVEVLGILEPLVLPLLAAAKTPSRTPMMMHLAPQVAAMKAAAKK